MWSQNEGRTRFFQEFSGGIVSPSSSLNKQGNKKEKKSQSVVVGWLCGLAAPRGRSCIIHGKQHTSYSVHDMRASSGQGTTQECDRVCVCERDGIHRELTIVRYT